MVIDFVSQRLNSYTQFYIIYRNNFLNSTRSVRSEIVELKSSISDFREIQKKKYFMFYRSA